MLACLDAFVTGVSRQYVFFVNSHFVNYLDLIRKT